MEVGRDCIISPNIRWRYPEKCKVGSHCIIDDFVYISCALELGCYSHISANVTLIGGGVLVKIGSFVDIGPGCVIASASQDYSYGELSLPTIPDEHCRAGIQSPIVIGDFCIIGANTTILPGVHLEEGTAIGCNSVVRGVSPSRPWTVYAGNPLREIKRRHKTPKHQAQKMLESQ